MGIKFDDQSVNTSGVQVRKGRGAPMVVGGGGVGIVGLIVFVLINVLSGGGIDASGLLVPQDGSVQNQGEDTGDLATRCNTEGAIDKYNDCFLVKVYNEINEVWAAELPKKNESYEQPALTFFTQGVSTECGPASSEVGPFYCPADRSIYLDIGFLQQLQKEFGAEGRYAQAYILAHEAGHHLQTLFGTEAKVRKRQQQNPKKENELSIALELQADCYAGVWSKLADVAGNVSIGDAEVAQAQDAAAAVGDDRIQKKTQGRVDEESWTHGSAQSRKKWFTRGRSKGDLDLCTTGV